MHLKGYKYSTLQVWDKSTAQARPRLSKPKSAPPKASLASQPDQAPDKLSQHEVRQKKISLARTLQGRVRRTLNEKHISAKSAFAAFDSDGDKIATVDDLTKGFTELGVKLPLEKNGTRPDLGEVIAEVLADNPQTVKQGDALGVDEVTFQGWIAPEPSEVATVFAEKILAKAGQSAYGEGKPCKDVERAQLNVRGIEAQLESVRRQMSVAEQTHAKTIALEANVSERQAAAVQRMEHEHSSAQRVRQGRQEELEQALAAGKTALEERKAKEAERNKQRHDAYAHKALRPRLSHASLTFARVFAQADRACECDHGEVWRSRPQIGGSLRGSSRREEVAWPELRAMLPLLACTQHVCKREWNTVSRFIGYVA